MRTPEFQFNEIRPLSRYVHDTTGIEFDEKNWIGLKVSIIERMHERKVEQPADYLTILRLEPYEEEELLALITVPETYFWRDQRQFIALRDHVLPEILKRKKKASPGKRPLIKIISAGCSTGEEPYSLAIAVHQSGVADAADVQVIAFDINKRSILRAKRAEYTNHSFREPNTPEIKSYFKKEQDHFIVNDEIKKRVTFQRANLFRLESHDIDISDADVVFFRNVQIYFDRDYSARAIQILEQSLNQEGYLFLGSAESLAWKKTNFKLHEFNDAMTWRKMDPVAERTQPTVIKSAAPAKKITKAILKPSPAARPKPKKIADQSHYENGLGYVKIKMFDKAEAEFKAQREKTPRHLETLIALARLYADIGKDEAAIALFEEALKIDNLSAELYFTRGLIHYKHENYGEAVESFKKTLYCDDQHFLAQFYLGLTYHALKKSHEANLAFTSTITSIQELGESGLKQDIAGYTGSYVLNLCEDMIGQEVNHE